MRTGPGRVTGNDGRSAVVDQSLAVSDPERPLVPMSCMVATRPRVSWSGTEPIVRPCATADRVAHVCRLGRLQCEGLAPVVRLSEHVNPQRHGEIVSKADDVVGALLR